jgi:hypothetical protein
MSQDIVAIILLAVGLVVGFWFCSVLDSQRK